MKTTDPELGDLSQLSRVELEPALAKLTTQGQVTRASAVVDELGQRTWLADNPYVE